MKDNLLKFRHNIPSTNKLLSEIARNSFVGGESVPPFFALYTDFQSEGHGMGNNKWFSEKGKNLLVSFYFEPGIPAAEQFVFNQYFAVTTRRFISQFAGSVSIKWPNDIYVAGKKLAGDLTEHTLSGDHIKYTIAGIGINLNQDWFPEEIPHPTSLFLETGQQFDPHQFLHDYHDLLVRDFNRITTDRAALQKEYLAHLYQMNEVGRYIITGKEQYATIRGIDHFGRLQLETERGQLVTCGFKEIVFL